MVQAAGAMRGDTQHSTWAERAFVTGGELRDEGDGAVYRVVRFLGRGGMGEVHEVVRLDTGACYALKCLLLQHARNTKTIERTRREALALRELRHPNVVRVHATGVRDDGLIWMVMDLLEGHTLGAVKRRLGKLPLPWALRIAADVAAGLAAVHAYAVHRDVKLENVHLGDDAVVRVLDLGAGKFHRSGLLTTGNSTLGTVPYMSPEQLSPGPGVDARSDLFSLGVVVTELVSGIHPFAPRGLAGENVYSLVRRIVSDAPVSLRVFAPWAPEYVVATVDRALARSRDDRWPTAAALRDAFLADLDHLERDAGHGEPLTTLVAELHRHDEEIPTIAAAPLAPQAEPAVAGVEDDADTTVMNRAR